MSYLMRECARSRRRLHIAYRTQDPRAASALRARLRAIELAIHLETLNEGT